MKILMTTDTVGGVFVYATALADALQRHGVDVVLATQGAPLVADQRKRIDSLDNVTLYESRYRLEWMHDPWDDVDAAGEWLQWIADREQPDVIHLNDYSHGALAWPAPVLTVAHSCVYSWFRAVRGASPGREWSTYRRRVAEGLRGADLVVAPTEAMLRAVADHYSVCRGRVIANGLAPPDIPRAGGEKRPLVLSAGRVWDQAKNIQTLAQTAPSLRWPVYVAGECRHPDGDPCHFEGVRFLGRLAPAQLSRWYQHAGIYALPALYEPFGLTALEAALAGCALVLGDIPSLREVWGEAATFVDPTAPGQLATAINRLADDEVLREKMAQRARSRAQQWSAARMAQQYWKAYHQLLEPTHRRRVATPVLEET